MSKNISDFNSLLSTINERAKADESFKKDLMSKPLDLINSISDSPVILPEGKRIEVVDQTDDQVIYINITNDSTEEDVELTDAQLELVAGGGGYPIILR